MFKTPKRLFVLIQKNLSSIAKGVVVVCDFTEKYKTSGGYVGWRAYIHFIDRSDPDRRIQVLRDLEDFARERGWEIHAKISPSDIPRFCVGV